MVPSHLGLEIWWLAKSFTTRISSEGAFKSNDSFLVKNPDEHLLIIGLLLPFCKHVDFLWWTLVLPSVRIMSVSSCFWRNSKWTHTQFRPRVNSQGYLLPTPMATFGPYCRHIVYVCTHQIPFEFVTCAYYWLSLVWATGNQLCERAVSFKFFLFLHFSFLPPIVSPTPAHTPRPRMWITRISKKKKLKS